jgi:hypothetical protein
MHADNFKRAFSWLFHLKSTGFNLHDEFADSVIIIDSLLTVWMTGVVTSNSSSFKPNDGVMLSAREHNYDDADKKQTKNKETCK